MKIQLEIEENDASLLLSLINRTVVNNINYSRRIAYNRIYLELSSKISERKVARITGSIVNEEIEGVTQ